MCASAHQRAFPCQPTRETYNTAVYLQEVAMSHIAKVFRAGNSRAVLLPKDFRFTVDEVEVTREGDAVILRPKLGTAGRWPRCARRSTGASVPTSWRTAGSSRTNSTVPISTQRFNDLRTLRHQRGDRAGEAPFGSASAQGRIHRDGFADHLFRRCP